MIQRQARKVYAYLIIVLENNKTKNLLPHVHYQITFIRCCIKLFIQVTGQNKLNLGMKMYSVNYTNSACLFPYNLTYKGISSSAHAQHCMYNVPKQNQLPQVLSFDV